MPILRTQRKRFTIFGYHISEQRVRRALSSVLLALIVFLLLVAHLRPEAVSYKIDDIADRTIKAARSATFLDTEGTQKLRDDAARQVAEVYTRDATAEGRVVQTLTDVCHLAAELHDDSNYPEPLDKVDRLREKLDLQLSPAALRLLVESTRGALDRLEQTTTMLARSQMTRQLRSNTSDLAQARKDVAEQVQTMGLAPRYQAVATELVGLALQPNMIYDAPATEARREEAQKKVTEIRRQIQPGDVVIFASDRVTQRHLDMFTALGLLRPQVDYGQALSLLAILLALTLALALYIRAFAFPVYNDDQLFLLLCATIIVSAALFSLIQGLQSFEVLALSIATAAAIFLAITLRPATAVGGAIFIAGVAGMAAPGTDARMLLAALLCSLLAAYAVRPAESRSNTISRAAVVTTIVNAFVYTVSSHVFGFAVTAVTIGYAAIGGLLSAVVAAGLVSLLERPLDLTTPLRLLELQNPNEPVLKRLLTEAPGSYQSSIMVANLAEPAAEAVGADPILTRTACMYHDIGKLKRPYFFVENQFGAENPHSRLPPHLSAVVIMSHIKEGVELATEIKLPPIVASVIPQHHGTTLASFMYQRAQAEARPGEVVHERDFRYPGPKPQTKENAIIMLADGVEAAARSLADPQPEAITDTVEGIVKARIADGQLDESPLTFADITVIKKSFIKTLTGMFHQRLPYPTNLTGDLPADPPPAAPAAASAASADAAQEAPPAEVKGEGEGGDDEV
jgi:putative nucleotidyltransferase with HDIG domain